MPALKNVRGRSTASAEPAVPVAPVAPAAAALPALSAALITLVSVCAGDAVARVFPFGPRTRSVSDLGNQFVPFHAQLWDLLHGRAEGGILLNWRSGYGTAFLPDLGTYLTSPFAVLVGLFPRDRIDLAVYAITLLKMAVAAAAMTVLLLRLARGARHSPRWAAAVLGAGYALCGWSIAEASYNPMWLDGLIAFPLLCLVGEWARTARRPVLGPLVVALAWTANFYTAYMATLGAALVLCLRLLLDGERTARERVRCLARATGTVLLGIGLAAPVLVPVFLGTRHASPGWTKEFVPVPWTQVFTRLFPATYGFFTPALFLGACVLLPAAALLAHRSVPGRVRVGWAALAVGVALSLQWGPTSLAWHAFAIPNGSTYRQTFILAGILVLTAWTAISHGWPGRRALLVGTGVLVAVALVATAGGVPDARATALFGGGLAAAVAGLALARTRGYAVLAALLVVGSLTGQAAATTAYVDRKRLSALDDYPAWGADQNARADAIAGADGWPRYRTDPGRERITANDPLLLGGEGGGYYSSHTPAVLTSTMAALGGGWTSGGRAVEGLDNPVTDAIFAVGARLRTEPGHAPVVVRAPAPPLVTVRPKTRDVPTAGDVPEPRYGRSPFRNQELLLGSRVYSRVLTSPGADAACPADTEVFLFAPGYYGKARLGDHPPVALTGRLPKRRAAMVSLGTAGRADLPMTFDGARPREWSVGCLDRKRLSAAVDRLTDTGAVSVTVTDSGVRAEVPAGSEGLAVLAAPRIAGWSCDGKPAASYLGLVATPLNGSQTTVDCSFRPPGLRLGSAVAGSALIVLVSVAFLTAARRRAMPASPPRHQPFIY
ncbi:YfhO family protein [Streptomyces sp. NPDC051662]|uniref:YfhO family protein n=1 Tax=Streptomyces sp. NPDC051662 TaxID=3154750 RepID=UPI0034132742